MFALLLRFLIGGVDAAPIAINGAGQSTPAIAPNNATCTTSFQVEGHGGAEILYEVPVGRPFIEGRGCPSIESLLSTNATVAEFKCVEDGAGQTNLTFVTPTDETTNGNIIHSLQLAYPMVPFERDGIYNMTTSLTLRKRKNFLAAPDDLASDATHTDGSEGAIGEDSDTGEEYSLGEDGVPSTSSASPDWSPQDSAEVASTRCGSRCGVPGMPCKRKIIEPRKAMTADTAKCGKWQDYLQDEQQKKMQVKIGRQYLGGANCGGVYELVKTKFALDEVTCEELNGDKDTELWVLAGANTKDFSGINEGLKAAHPMVEEFASPTS